MHYIINTSMQTLARAERSHAGRFKKALDEVNKK
jgi:rubrerythrin